MKRLLGLILLLLLAGRGLAQGIPFGPGEEIQFRIGWGFINAGTSWLRVKDTVTVRDRLCWQIESEARSNEVISKLYPVRDRVLSWMDVRDLTSRGVAKHLREGSFKRDRVFEIDPEGGEIRQLKEGELHKQAELEHHVQDVLSAFYWVRTQPLEVGRELHVKAVDNMKHYELAIRVLKRETVKVRAGEFDCFLIQPLLVGDGLFKADGEIWIWVTADERRIPVKMKSKIFIGSIHAQMENYRPPLEVELPMAAEEAHLPARRREEQRN